MHPPGGRDARRAAALAALLLVSCTTEEALSPGPPAPEILASAVAGNPNNVLSVMVTARTRFVDSVAVRYGLAGEGLDSASPAAKAEGDSAVVPILGLLPEAGYVLEVVAYGGGSVSAGDRLTATTATLPADLPRYVASGPDPSPGYVVFAAGPYGLAIDNTGRVVWYRRFPNGLGLNFEVQPTGRYYAHPPTPAVGDIEPWVEIDPFGDVTRTFGCVGGLPSRFHDLIAEPDGAYWVMCDEIRTMDLSSLGGVADAHVMGTVVQHVSAAGALLFQWSPFDHFEITDLEPASRTGQNVNWTHGNSLDLDTDGNLVVSFRSLSEITKIDTKTGAILWRMGGLKNQFTFQDAPTPAFAFQHGLRLPGFGRLLLLDNMGDPGGSWAERYVYDGALHTARMVSSYGSDPPVTASLGGSTQNLPGERALVSYGPAGRVEEYDAAGQVVWHIEGNPGYVFRAQRIESLYRPGVGLPR